MRCSWKTVITAVLFVVDDRGEPDMPSQWVELRFALHEIAPWPSPGGRHRLRVARVKIQSTSAKRLSHQHGQSTFFPTGNSKSPRCPDLASGLNSLCVLTSTLFQQGGPKDPRTNTSELVTTAVTFVRYSMQSSSCFQLSNLPKLLLTDSKQSEIMSARPLYIVRVGAQEGGMWIHAHQAPR